MANENFRDLLIRTLVLSDDSIADLDVTTGYKRQVWDTLNQSTHRFLRQPENQWIIMPGLRGVGKTTLLAQLYKHPALPDDRVKKFYLSLEKLSLMGASMNDLVEALQHLRRSEPDKLFLICLDEVHFDPLWSIGCKIIFDQLPKSLLVCTGSSALSLRLNPDSARRATIIRVPPLSLTEFIAIRQAHRGAGQPTKPDPDLASRLRRAILDEHGAVKTYTEIIACSNQVKSYYRDLKEKSPWIPNKDLRQFIDQTISDYINNYGSLPIGCRVKDEQLDLQLDAEPPDYDENLGKIRESILQTINESVVGDSFRLLSAPNDNPRVGFQLQASTISLLPKLVRTLANKGQISLAKTAKELGDTHQKTLSMMLRVLTLSEIIIEIAPRGTSIAKSSKTPKYLFAAPAIRRALVPLSHHRSPQTNNEDANQLRGRLLEDTTAMHLTHIFDESKKNWVMEYDSRKGGADFILSPDGRKENSLVLEVGYRKNNSEQVRRTLKDGGRSGLVISSGIEPRINSDENIAHMPLEYFLLA